MGKVAGILRWLAPLVALAALWLPALTVAAEPFVPEYHWSGLALAADAANHIAGRPDAPGSYSFAIERLGAMDQLVQSVRSAAGAASPDSSESLSNILKVAGELPYAFLLLGGFALAAVAGLALRRHILAAMAAGLGLVCAAAALTALYWLAHLAATQWTELAHRYNGRLALPSWNAIVGLRIEPCLYVAVLAFLIYFVLPPRSAPEVVAASINASPHS